ncbi:MAG: helix-turn-helix domain-containing protein [Solirubrobacterales bacterium]
MTELTPSRSLRDRKKADTRRRALAAALELFERDGFEATTVEVIAERAGIAPRTYFRYFPTKVDVLFADHEDRVELLRATIAARPSRQSVVGAVKAATLAEIERMMEGPESYLARTRLVASIPAARVRVRGLDGDFEDVIAAAIVGAGGNPDTDLEARETARAAWAATRSAQHVWHAGGGTENPAELVEEAFALLRRGFR